MSSTLSPNPLNPETLNGFEPDLYVLPVRVAAISKAPRFTGYACFGDALEDQTQSQYMIGALSGTIFVLCAYIVWVVVILVFKCLGPDKVGCASGVPRPPTKPIDPNAAAAVDKLAKDDDDKDEESSSSGSGGETPPATPDTHGAEDDFLSPPPTDDAGRSALDAPEIFPDESAPPSPGGGSGDGDDPKSEPDEEEEGGAAAAARAEAAAPPEDAAPPSTAPRECAFRSESGDQDVTPGAAEEASPDPSSDSTAKDGGEDGSGALILIPPTKDGGFDGFDDQEEGDDDDYESALVKWEVDMRRHTKRMFITRILFFISGACVVLSSVLFYAQGIGGLNDALLTVTDGIGLIQNILLNAHNLTELFIDSQTNILETRHNFSAILDQCPALLEAQPDIARETALEALQTAAPHMAEGLNATSIFINSIATGLLVGIEDAVHQSSVANEKIQDTVSMYFWVAVACLAMLNFLVGVLMAMAVSQWRRPDRENCFTRGRRRKFAAKALLVLFGFLGWLMASILILATIAGSDFCIAPDVYVQEILGDIRNATLTEIGLTFETWKNITLSWRDTIVEVGKNTTVCNNLTVNNSTHVDGNVTFDEYVTHCLDQNTTDEITNNIIGNVTDVTFKFVLTGVFDLAIYYAGQCQLEFLPLWYAPVDEFMNGLTVAVADISAYLTAVEENGSPEVEALCGPEIANTVTQLASTLNDQLRTVWDSLVGALGLLACSSVNPVYNRIAHDAVCLDGIEWLSWSFATAFCVAFFSMLMFSLRAPWYSPAPRHEPRRQRRGCRKSSVNDAAADAEGGDAKSPAEEEEEYQAAERRERIWAYVLWSLLLTFMCLMLVALIAYSLNGFNGGDKSKRQCPAEHEQFLA